MKINTLPIVISFIVCTFYSCNNEKDDNAFVYKDVSLSLNEGQKWVVPAPMKMYMDSSLALIDQLEQGEVDLLEVKDDLITYKNRFVSNCSMKGKGHDVLHDWLIPYMGILDMLSEGNSNEKNEQIKAELIEAKRLYLDHFK